MKIAIISDIHGNLYALNTVLNDIKNEKCEMIFCLGDLAMAGAEPNSTIEFVKNQDWKIIQGNTDEMIAYFNNDVFDKVKSAAPIMANALKSDATEISEENKLFLKNLPKQMELNVDGLKILLVHGSPRKNNEEILPNMPIVEIEEIFKDIDADIVFCGHTHIPCGYQTNSNITVVNVGSVGRPFTEIPNSCYAIADLNKGNISISHKFVPYDIDSAFNILKNRLFEGADKLADMLKNPTLRHM